MSDAIIYLDPTSHLNLQSQIRQKLVDAIASGSFPPGSRLPSSRKMATQLRVARNTVVLVYQQLTDEGLLVSRQRSGIYVSDTALDGKVRTEPKAPVDVPAEELDWPTRLKNIPSKTRKFEHPSNWQQYPYPFLDGQFEASLYPIAAWREATRLSLGVRDVNQWSTHNDDVDDRMLIEEIRTKVLPRRGIQAKPEEILITVGAQQAIYLLIQMLVDSSVPVAIEEPCSPDLRGMLAQRGTSLIHQFVDADGLIVDDSLDQAELVFVTPSHQVPTAVTMSMERREALLAKARQFDFLIVEDDFENETNYLGSQHPALRSIDNENRVIYVSSLSKVLAPGVSLGFMVASPELIEAARSLRQLMVRSPPLNNQRAAAYFLSLGHYDTYMLRLSQIFRERWIALRDALNYTLQQYSVTTHSQGGTTCWVRAPEGVEVGRLIVEAAQRGILLEPVSHFYAFSENAQNCFRMGVTSLSVDRIREGVEQLAELIRDMASGHLESLHDTKGRQVTGEELKKLFVDGTLLSKTVYEDPFSIEMQADGSMIGKAGYRDEDCDVGQWWVEGDKWFRRWDHWAYAETAGYFTVIDGNQVKMFNDKHQKIFTAVLYHGEPVDYKKSK
ncbi:MAG: PLP-dependent aminotransferase family protein [Porticoccaceae bacterium]|jgi:GntR family transcriptional regulator / MocR family aminotransferase|nr:PLP-dependent aminotransferase family protein [Porticoccaceae bacterium]